MVVVVKISFRVQLRLKQLNKIYFDDTKDSWGDKELTGFVTMDGLKLTKVFKVLNQN